MSVIKLKSFNDIKLVPGNSISVELHDDLNTLSPICFHGCLVCGWRNPSDGVRKILMCRLGENSYYGIHVMFCRKCYESLERNGDDSE